MTWLYRWKRMCSLFIITVLFGSILIQCTSAPATILQNLPIQQDAAVSSISQEEDHTAVVLQDHLLLDTIDLLSAPNVDVLPLTPVNTIPLSTTDSWNEAIQAATIVRSTSDPLHTAIIHTTSYKFSSIVSATQMLDPLPHNPTILSLDLQEILDRIAISWKVLYMHDHEGLPTYIFFLQKEYIVTQLNIIVDFEQNNFALAMLEPYIERLSEKAQGTISRWNVNLPFLTRHSPSLEKQQSSNIQRIYAKKTPFCKPRFDQFPWGWGWLFRHCAAEWDNNGPSQPQYLDSLPDGNTRQVCIPIVGNNECNLDIQDKFKFCYHVNNVEECHEEPWGYWDAPSGKTRMGVLTRMLRNLGVNADTPSHIYQRFSANFLVSPSCLQESVNNISSSLDTIALCPTPSPGPQPTPPPGTQPTATPPPSSQGISVLHAWPQGSIGEKGREFHPQITIQTHGFSLNCGQSYLENRDGNLYGAHPIQGCTALGNNQYKIAFGSAMRAPDSSGEYHSRWQMWQHPNHIGPEIDLWFRVAQEPDHGQPPSNPTLKSPHNWFVSRDGNAPELCWNASSDPDGDAIEYFVEVRGAHIAESGWISQTCWRPSTLDGRHFGYGWRVKAKDSRGIQSGWSDSWNFNIEPAPYDPIVPTSTPPAATPPPSTPGSWWHPDWRYRRPIPISTQETLPAGTIIKVDGLNLDMLITQGKARSDYHDIRVVRKSGDSTWQEVARTIYTGWDLEFRLVHDLPIGTDTSYYMYYGNPAAGAPPTFALPQGWWVDMYIDKGWGSYHSTWSHNEPMDFGIDEVCNPPLNHHGRTGQSFDESDKFRGRLYIPTTGEWTFKVFTNDGYAMYLDGVLVDRYDGYDINRWITMQPITLKAGWHSMDLRNMWVNCGAWRFGMEGPNFPFQIVPASHFQQVWGNVRAAITPGGEELAPTVPTPTPPPATALPFFGSGIDGHLVVNQGQTVTINATRVPVSAQGLHVNPNHSTGFQPGDVVLLHQSQGTDSVGAWEIRQIASIDSATHWTLSSPLTYSYDSINGKAQAVKIPQYQSVTIHGGGILTAPGWDGATGGILMFFAATQAQVHGTITMSGKGFRGGAYAPHHQYAQSGEGIYRTFSSSPQSNGNGGGGAENASSGDAHSGGGGGGNGSPGATGHHGHGTAGVGGTTSGTETLSRATFGGGGGGGVCGWDTCHSGSGGTGGGVIMLLTHALDVSGIIASEGIAGQNGDQGGWAGSGTGGGGAGGSILIRASQATLGSHLIRAQFGTGGIGWTGGAPTESGRGGTGRVRIEYCSSMTGTTIPAASNQHITCTTP